MFDSRRRRVFIFWASAAPALCLAAVLAFYFAGLKHYHLSMARYLVRFTFVRAELFDPRFRRLTSALADLRVDQAGEFATVWDTNRGALLSRRLFRTVDMYGVQKYAYKPNLNKVSFRTRAGGLALEIETAETPGLRAALRDTDIESMTSASYDQFGHRRVDAELTQDCEVTVLFLGDSFTDGMWVGDSDTFVNRYGHLARERSRIAVCPVNAGVNGYGSLEESYVLEHSFEESGRPRLVILMYFANDVDADYAAVLDGTLVDPGPKWTESLSYLRRAAAFARRQGSTFVLAAIPPAEQMSAPSTRKNYQDVLRRFCLVEGIPFVDLLSGLDLFDVHDIYWDWDPHFTPRGHQVVADILYRETQSLLASPASASGRSGRVSVRGTGWGGRRSTAGRSPRAPSAPRR